MADDCSPYGCSVYNSASAPTDSGFVSVVNVGSKPLTTASCVTRSAVEPTRNGTHRNLVYQSDGTGYISRTSTGTIVRIGGGNVGGGTVNGGVVNGGTVNRGYVNGGYVNGGYDTSAQQTPTLQNGMTVLPVRSPHSAPTLTNGRATVNTTSVTRHAVNPQTAAYDQRTSWPVAMQYAASHKYHQSPPSLARDRSVESRRSSSGEEKKLGSGRLYLVVFLLLLCILIVLGVGLYFILYHSDVIN